MRSRKLDGRRLRAIREERALTLLELAAKVTLASDDDSPDPLHWTTVSTWENGKRQPTPKNFRALCAALDVPREDLLLAEDARSGETEQVAS